MKPARSFAMTTNRRSVIVGLSSMTGFAGATSHADPIPFSKAYLERLAFLEKDGRYLPAYLEAKAALATARGDDLYFALEMFGMIAARVGDEDGALASSAKRWPPRRSSPPDLSNYVAEDALNAIVRAARGRRVVVLNEAHYSSRCRAFGAQVAQRLAADGFSVFAAEDFATERAEAKLNSVAPITTDLGVYIGDPQFAELVRRARAARMTFHEYEQTSAQEKDHRVATREEAEATNLAQILDEAPDARVFVYCGYAHAGKAPIGKNIWMAARLKQMTGIDPLCIDQTEGLPHDDPADESSELTAVLSRFAPSRPIVVKSPDGAPYELGAYNGAVDMSVFHPRLTKVDGRPGWLASGPRRRLETELPPGRKDQVLVQALPWAEAAAPNVVPADQVLAAPETHSAALFVRPGRYVLRMETVAGVTVLGTVNVV